MKHFFLWSALPVTVYATYSSLNSLTDLNAQNEKLKIYLNFQFNFNLL